MKNIEPFNPDIKPEEKPVAAPAEPAPEPQPIPVEPPAPATNDQTPSGILPQKPIESATTPAQANQAIYPEPLSIDERRQRQEKTFLDAKRASGFSLSQILIPGIVVSYAIYSVVKTLQSISAESAYAALAYASGPGGAFISYIWLGIIFGLSLAIMAIIVSYKIFRGSKVALALLTGPIVIYFQYELMLYVTALASYGQMFGSTNTILKILAEIVLVAMFVLAWTKDRKNYA